MAVQKRMKVKIAVACIILASLFSIECSATSRYKILSFFFDGVPDPNQVQTLKDQPDAASARIPSRQIAWQHGPYAAKQCTACHKSVATNALVAPREQLCFQCHEFSQMEKAYVHGPIASGSCTICHDPHSSKYRYLLVSDSDDFCSYCHDPQLMAKVEAHKETKEQCTACHDAHASDKKYLLK